ncbi:polyprenyl synthetase family protein [Streptomyces sp. DG2A-72]|uniref:polyprenyl synthetase family protein n=1 Tax=Streptomyces sp. DG2A-72 TaxID=3051386 RepID=UPI00265BD233|nr:polyprenyl synthetase family protein [Streptomyces sp. DG2A-72]MDO0931722.1 polyprenyl synthetase family protein [Streptomyces sp. DG2A-72]
MPGTRSNALLHIGAVLAGVDPSLLDTLTAYALTLGEAFQLREGLLGVFGDPDVTARPAWTICATSDHGPARPRPAVGGHRPTRTRCAAWSAARS